MKYIKLEKTDIEVSRICVGGMSFGERTEGGHHPWTLDAADTEKMIAHAFAMGVNFIDTANGYANGTSEEFIGKAIKNLGIQRDKIVIATKVFFNEGKLKKEAIAREIEGSLKRLGTDYVDLYQIHRFDYDTLVEETMQALHNLVKAGKVCALVAPRCTAISFSICSWRQKKMAGHNFLRCRIITTCFTARTSMR